MCCNSSTPTPSPPAPAPGTPPCQNCRQCPQTFIEKMRACNDGIWDDARAALGRDPNIVEGTPAGGFGGHADYGRGEVVIGPNPDPCTRVQTLLFELNNLASTPQYRTIDTNAAAGNVSRDEYIRQNERVEYEGLRRVLAAHDRCKATWCCDTTPSRYEWMRAARDFDDYFDNYLAQSHKDYYGGVWDRNYQAAYRARHP